MARYTEEGVVARTEFIGPGQVGEVSAKSKNQHVVCPGDNQRDGQRLVHAP